MHLSIESKRDLPDQAFSSSLDAFISHHWYPGTPPQDWFHALHRQGWLVPDWPRELGGPGWSRQQQVLWIQAQARHLCPLPDDRFRIIAPLLLGLGSHQQQAQYLPGIMALSRSWGLAQDHDNQVAVTPSAEGWRLTGAFDYQVVNYQKGDDQTPDLGRSGSGAPQAATCFCLLLQDPGAHLLIDLNRHDMPEDGRVSVTPSQFSLEELFVSRASLLGKPGQGRQALARHQSSYLILLELHLALAHITRGIGQGANQKGYLQKSHLQKGYLQESHKTLATQLTQFQIRLDAMLRWFLEGGRELLLNLEATEMRSRAIKMLQELMGYYLLLHRDETPGSDSHTSNLHTSNLHTSNEPRLPFEEEAKVLADLQRHLGDALSGTIQRDLIYQQISEANQQAR